MGIETLKITEGKVTTDELHKQFTKLSQDIHSSKKFWVSAENLKEAYELALLNDGDIVVEIKSGNVGNWLEVSNGMNEKPIIICN